MDAVSHIERPKYVVQKSHIITQHFLWLLILILLIL
jgi:hypothetical protein